MTTLTSATQQSLVLFNQGSVTEGSSDSSQELSGRLSDISPASNLTITQSKVSTETPTSMRVTKNFERLKSLIPTDKEGMLAAAKSIWKGTALGAISGAVAGLALANIAGAFKGACLGAFLGGLCQTAVNTYQNMKNELKQELLEQASFHVTQEGNETKLSEGGTESEQKVDVNYQNTTMFYTEGKKSINLSKLGDSIKGSEPKIAITLLNARNNAKHEKLQKLDLSNNGYGLNEKFLTNLIKFAGAHAGKEISVDGVKSKVRHGLDKMSIDVTKSEVKSGDDLKNLLLSAQVGEEVSVNTVAGSGAAQISFKPEGIRHRITIDLAVDKDFSMQSKQSETEVADGLAPPSTRAASVVATPSELPLATNQNLASVFRVATESEAGSEDRQAEAQQAPPSEATPQEIPSEAGAVYDAGTVFSAKAASGPADADADASIPIGGPSYTGETSQISDTTRPLAPAI